MSKLIAEFDISQGDADDVITTLKYLKSCAPKGSVVLVQAMASDAILSGGLYEDSLSDGSKVYRILLG